MYFLARTQLSPTQTEGCFFQVSELDIEPTLMYENCPY